MSAVPENVPKASRDEDPGTIRTATIHHRPIEQLGAESV